MNAETIDIYRAVADAMDARDVASGIMQVLANGARLSAAAGADIYNRASHGRAALMAAARERARVAAANYAERRAQLGRLTDADYRELAGARPDTASDVIEARTMAAAIALVQEVA